MIVNATDPRLNPQIFAAAFEARCTYLDMAMTLSEPDSARPYEVPGVMLGDAQFDQDERWRDAGLLALLGIGVEPGLSDVFARYAADHLFSSITEIGVRDGANLVVEGYRLLANTGRNSGPEIPHLHVHIFGGRPLGPMLAH